MQKQKYLVLREHGAFVEGDTRDLTPIEAGRLEKLGVIEKMKQAPQNKMMREAENKARPLEQRQDGSQTGQGKPLSSSQEDHQRATRRSDKSKDAAE
ncbi:hypothetical protein FJ959_09770 [Mesorhizobium sp. B2-2-4]|uniref:hypothetical protein n=1 Tax=unclassified Mesorhizobium TaxID=325217 RepID=UPI001129E834|nr:MULTISPECIES: hypothetical protein [unclassified Mesorhizobium]TPL49223.1 hypothetical protein FJ937_17240 [Mesorhizobium sp. B2-4-4]TPM59146.1 hypothetical protein FJ959_09770 [Mesorhizobium sp. B2-2-4]TPM67631.1 hypothetical protein FJ965_10910 [Mesorhizobium sp. B2-2-1]TPN66913.1 hypothetical protein FJ984_15775 [Mesorhizobium sp. B1-1-3]